MKKVLITLLSVWLFSSQWFVLHAQVAPTYSLGSDSVASVLEKKSYQPMVSLHHNNSHLPVLGGEVSLKVQGRKGIKDAFGSPYQLSWKKDGIISGVGMLSTVAAYSLDDAPMTLSVEKAAQFTRQDVNWFDRSATYRYSKDLKEVSDQLGSFALIAPLALLADKQIRNDLLTVGAMFLETRLFAAALPTFAKRGVKRYRPFVYNPDVAYEDKVAKDPGQSFFANQTTSVFATAVFMATVYGDYHPDSKWKPWVWTGSLLAASTISYVRYETGTHYASDILVGALVGSAIGYTIPVLHRINTGKFKIMPQVSRDAYLLNLQLKL